MTVENTNLIEAGGRIIRARRTYSGNVIMTLLINDHRHISQIPFVHHGLIDRSLMGNAKVIVKGHIYVAPTFNELTRRQNEVPSFLVDDIQLRKTQMEEAFGVAGHFCGIDYFTGKFTGTISRLIKSDNENWGVMIVLVDGYNGNTPSSITFNYYLKGRLPSFDRFKEGDRVAIVSSVHTSTKTIRGEERTFVDLGVEDIVKINESAEAEPENTNEPVRTENSRERRRRRRLMIMHNENRGSAPDEPGKGLPTTDELNDGLSRDDDAEKSVPENSAQTETSVPASDVSAETPNTTTSSVTEKAPSSSADNNSVEEKNSTSDSVNVSSGNVFANYDTDNADDSEDSDADTTDLADSSDDNDDDDYDDSDFLSQFKK